MYFSGKFARWETQTRICLGWECLAVSLSVKHQHSWFLGEWRGAIQWVLNLSLLLEAMSENNWFPWWVTGGPDPRADTSAPANHSQLVWVSCKCTYSWEGGEAGLEEMWNQVSVPTMCSVLQDKEKQELAGKISNWKHMPIPCMTCYQSQMMAGAMCCEALGRGNWEMRISLSPGCAGHRASRGVTISQMRVSLQGHILIRVSLGCILSLQSAIKVYSVSLFA